MACVERNVRNLGDPGSSWVIGSGESVAQEIRILSHKRGNPETEVGRTLNAALKPGEGESGRLLEAKRRAPRTAGESDHLIVLRDGRADHRGKGVTGIRSLQRKHCADVKGRISSANLTAGDSDDGRGIPPRPSAEASIPEEPGARKPHAGICAGAVGQPAVLPR